MLGIIDLVCDLTWLRSEISYRINFRIILLRWVWCCFVVIPWKWSFSIGSNKENEFSSSWLPFTFFLLHHSWFSTPPSWRKYKDMRKNLIQWMQVAHCFNQSLIQIATSGRFHYKKSLLTSKQYLYQFCLTNLSLRAKSNKTDANITH